MVDDTTYQEKSGTCPLAPLTDPIDFSLGEQKCFGLFKAQLHHIVVLLMQQ